MNDELYQKENPTVPKEWPDSYYDVEDMKRRQDLLKEHMEQMEEALKSEEQQSEKAAQTEKPQDEKTVRAEEIRKEQEADRFREKLFLSRYAKKKDQDIDQYIANFYRLRLMAAEPPGFFGKRSAIREVNEILGILCCGCDTEDAMEKELCFLELKHAIRVYIGICKRDKQYGSVLLGFGRKKASSILSKMVSDFENMTVTFPRKLQLEKSAYEKMDYLRKAIAEAFHEEEPAEERWYQHLKK